MNWQNIFKGEWVRIDDKSSYGDVEYGSGADLEEVSDRIRGQPQV
jgi:hypothetical protein